MLSGSKTFLTFDVNITILTSLFNISSYVIILRCVYISSYVAYVVDFMNIALVNISAFSLNVVAVILSKVNVSVRRYRLALQYCRVLNTFSLLFISRNLFHLSLFARR